MTDDNTIPPSLLDQHLKFLKLSFMRDQHQELAGQASKKHWSHLDYLEKLAEGEAALRRDRSIQRRIRLARFPVVKTLDQFNWSWPKKINRLQVQNLFRLQFVADKSNVIFLGGVGLGKTHLAAALGYAACLKGNTVLFATAIDVINTLSAAKAAGRMKQEVKKYTRPLLLIIDELGFLPIDKAGADLLFQVISQRHETKSTAITTNLPFADWGKIFDSTTVATAIADRLVYNSQIFILEGPSYRKRTKPTSQ